MSQAPMQFPPAPLTVRDQIRVRAEFPESADKVFLMHDARRLTYRGFRDESSRVAHFLLNRLGKPASDSSPHVAMLLENHIELLTLYGGCAVSGATLFGVNTGLRGETLAGVLNQSRARILVVEEKLMPEVERIRGELKLIPGENLMSLPEFTAALEREVGPASKSLPFPDAKVTPQTNLMVIYTSGTTGLPKGINNNHFKLCATGIGVSGSIGAGKDTVGYACMPLFHSNSMFVCLMPCFWVGGSVGIRERFSGSRFVPDVFEYGSTVWNYVGEPVHYVLAAIEREYGGDEERIRREVTENPKNKLKNAVGNGASPVDIDRFVKWLGLEDMFELYGSTEAAISTMRRKGDPRGSVGEITDSQVRILREDGRECVPAELDADGKIANYDAAVGEICRVSTDTGLFQGYFDNAEANSSKYRDGTYHSGDLGHVLVRDGKRFLFFDGRTDDWIRKDGENFSALQVARLLSEHPDVPLAAAYGVPCSVSDELVMVSVKLRDGARFDPKSFFDFCEKQVTAGDSSFKPFTPSDWEKVRDVFRKAERLHLLER